MNAIIDFLKELVTRLQTESPDFFKKLRSVAFFLMIVIWSMVAYDTYIKDFIGQAYENLFENIGYVISAVFAFTWTPVKK